MPLTAEHAREIRAINAVMPGLKWKPCRICGEYAPMDLEPGVGNRHVMCFDGPKVPLPRRNNKEIDVNQGQLI